MLDLSFQLLEESNAEESVIGSRSLKFKISAPALRTPPPSARLVAWLLSWLLLVLEGDCSYPISLLIE